MMPCTAAPTIPRAAPSVNETSGLRADARRDRQRLLEAAREVFAEDGLDASLNEVARRAGVGVATLFRRFPTREDLIAATFAHPMTEYAALIETALADSDPWHGFCGYVRAVCAMQAGDRGFTDVLTQSFPTAKEFEAQRNRAFIRFTELIAGAKKAGGLRDDFVAEDLPMLLMANAGVVRGHRRRRTRDLIATGRVPHSSVLCLDRWPTPRSTDPTALYRALRRLHARSRQDPSRRTSRWSCRRRAGVAPRAAPRHCRPVALIVTAALHDLQEHAADGLGVEVCEVAVRVAVVEHAELLHLLDPLGVEVEAGDQVVVVVGRDRERAESAGPGGSCRAQRVAGGERQVLREPARVWVACGATLSARRTDPSRVRAGPRRVVLVHAIRNAALPIVAMIGLDIGLFMSGAVVVEFGVRMARHRPACLAGHPARRHPDHHRRDNGRCLIHRHREPAGGPRGAVGRPEDTDAMRRSLVVTSFCIATCLAGSQATGGSGSAGRSGTQEASDACARAASSAGKHVTSVASARPDNNGGVDVQLNVKTARGSASVDCRYDGRQAHVGRDGKRDNNKSWLRWFE